MFATSWAQRRGRDTPVRLDDTSSATLAGLASVVAGEAAEGGGGDAGGPAGAAAVAVAPLAALKGLARDARWVRVRPRTRSFTVAAPPSIGFAAVLLSCSHGSLAGSSLSAALFRLRSPCVQAQTSASVCSSPLFVGGHRAGG